MRGLTMTETTQRPPRDATTSQARTLRRRATLTERRLWALLRDRRLDGLKFRRQVPVGPYVLDFVCLAHRLIVEADGPFHDPAHDALRDQWLITQGFHVLRFTNNEILGDGFRVIAQIQDTASLLPSREKVAAKPTDEGAVVTPPRTSG
jgi:very-short-patch-repair endonuclease